MQTIDIVVRSHSRCEMIDITSEVSNVLHEHRIIDAIVTLFTPHTTAALTINENADPDVTQDMLYGLNLLVPENPRFKHAEGNSDAHIKSSLFGVSETLIVEEGKLQLGTWQGIYFCEFDGPRIRTVKIKCSNPGAFDGR